MPELEAIAYVSNAARGLTEDQLEKLLAASRERNQSLGITGVLLFDHDLFFQYFEGPPANVATLYDSIRRSALHSGLYLMLREPIAQRAFPDWSMGFSSAPHSDILRIADADWKKARESLDAAHGASSMGLKMLSQFWKTSLDA